MRGYRLDSSMRGYRLAVLTWDLSHYYLKVGVLWRRSKSKLRMLGMDSVGLVVWGGYFLL